MQNSILNQVLYEFHFYGFTYSPLTEAEILDLIEKGYDAADIYGIGCDVNSGFTIEEAIK